MVQASNLRAESKGTPDAKFRSLILTYPLNTHISQIFNIRNIFSNNPLINQICISKLLGGSEKYMYWGGVKYMYGVDE